MTILISLVTLLVGVASGCAIAQRSRRKVQTEWIEERSSLQGQIDDKNRSITFMFELILKSAQNTQNNVTKTMSDLFEETSKQAQNSAANMAEIAHRVQRSKTLMSTMLDQMTALATKTQDGMTLSEQLNTTLIEFRDTSTRFASVQESILGIRQKTDAINSIGQEAEMLALNAAIEAARAGEAGRGFAVVADSMKTLAKSSQQMSTDIQDVLTESHAKIEQTTQQLLERSEALMAQTDTLVTTYHDVSDSVSQGSRSTQELNDDFEQTLSIVSSETESTRTNMETIVREFAIKSSEVTGLKVTDLTPQNVHQRLAEFDYLIDVRRPEEYNDELGHIPGSKLITLQTDFPQAVKDLPKDKRYLFICRSGGRSTKAAQQAQLQNIQQVYNLDGGMLAWREAGY